ncbi:hypothetical protein OZL46_18145 [Bacillus sonorensis]|nr:MULTISPECIES: hypothetical protein [Bacillus subtilis group]MCZ0070310.1 hypothetical protein [Bacillus sonorensis]MCZ0097698.1 hypothetical protein [Bacillus sonorensis]MEC1518525.1 hypothetical protein [Bacillus sonorensis]QAW14537.1 hypothetical protein ETA10_21615 [Bacillus subtilis]WBU34488.1 hypothetical protein OSK17_22225 [Bacillus subtilis]
MMAINSLLGCHEGIKPLATDKRQDGYRTGANSKYKIEFDDRLKINNKK